MNDARKVWDVERRRWTTMGALGACCDACAHSHPSSVATQPCGSCASRSMQGATNPPANAAIDSAVCDAMKGRAVFVVASGVLWGAGLGAVIGAVAQDKGKRGRGAAWGAGTGALLSGALAGLSILVSCAGTSKSP